MTAYEAMLEDWSPTGPRVGAWRAAWRRFRSHRAALAGAVVVLALALAALGADVLATHDPYEQFLRAPAEGPVDPLEARDTGKYLAPSGEHWFGTDHLARDIFSRTLVGLRISLAAALFAIVVVTAIGVAVGAAAGAWGGWVDGLLMRATDVAYAFPDLLLIILLRAALGDQVFGRSAVLGVPAGVLLLFVAISVTAWPTTARLVRAQILVLREMEFSAAAEALGATRGRLVFRHWLPGAAAPVVVEASFLVPRAIFAEATLSFIGIGVTPPTPSLGTLIADHFGFVALQWTALAIPTALLVVLFLVVQLVGEGVQDAVSPREAGSRR